VADIGEGVENPGEVKRGLETSSGGLGGRMVAKAVRGGCKCWTASSNVRRRPGGMSADTARVNEMVKGFSSLIESRGMSRTLRLTSMSETGKAD
jgi:hypothetical protein